MLISSLLIILIKSFFTLEKTLNIIEDFVRKTDFIGKHVIGPRFNRKLKILLSVLDRAKELFILVLYAD
jgi:hypothetical protein